MWNFRGYLWNFTPNILPIHWKIWFVNSHEDYLYEIYCTIQCYAIHCYLKLFGAWEKMPLVWICIDIFNISWAMPWKDFLHYWPLWGESSNQQFQSGFYTIYPIRKGNAFFHILQCCLTGTGTILWLPQWQQSVLEHKFRQQNSKLCLILAIYCLFAIEKSETSHHIFKGWVPSFTCSINTESARPPPQRVIRMMEGWGTV